MWQHCIDKISTFLMLWKILHLFGSTTLIYFRPASFDIHTHMYIIHSGLLWLRRSLAPCSEWPSARVASCSLKNRSWHCWQMRDSFAQTSIISLYGAFCKHHGHRTILCVSWRQLLAQKHYEKKEVSLQARIGFSQNWWCPNQLDFQFFTIAVLLLQPFCHTLLPRITILKS